MVSHVWKTHLFWFRTAAQRYISIGLISQNRWEVKVGSETRFEDKSIEKRKYKMYEDIEGKVASHLRC